MKHMLAFIALLALAMPASGQATYQTQRQAQSHCPMDSVVWLNVRTQTYYTEGQRWFGRRGGAYACRWEAEHAGYRQSRNGQ